jgi:hypothetical protein
MGDDGKFPRGADLGKHERAIFTGEIENAIC